MERLILVKPSRFTIGPVGMTRIELKPDFSRLPLTRGYRLAAESRSKGCRSTWIWKLQGHGQPCGSQPTDHQPFREMPASRTPAHTPAHITCFGRKPTTECHKPSLSRSQGFAYL